MSEIYTTSGFNEAFEWRQPDVEYPLADFGDIATRRIVRYYESPIDAITLAPRLNTRDETYTDAFLVSRGPVTYVDGELVRYTLIYHTRPPSRVDFQSMSLIGAVTFPGGFNTYTTIAAASLERDYFLIGSEDYANLPSPQHIELLPKNLIFLPGFGFVDADFIAGGSAVYRVADDVIRRVEGNIWERTRTTYTNIQPQPPES